MTHRSKLEPKTVRQCRYTLCSLSDGALSRFRFEVYLFGPCVGELSWRVCLVWTKDPVGESHGRPRSSPVLNRD